MKNNEWTAEEKTQFERGLKECGWGDWEGVAEYVLFGHAHNIGKVEKKRLMRLYKS